MSPEWDLLDWATIVLISDAFYWEREDRGAVDESLNRLSVDFIPED
jgi:hypothetical protein